MSHNVKVSIERAGEDLKAMVAKAMWDADCENVILPGDINKKILESRKEKSTRRVIDSVGA